MKPETLIQVAALAAEMSSYSNAQLLNILENERQYCREQLLAACRVQQMRQFTGQWFKSFEEAEAARASFAMEVAA